MREIKFRAWDKIHKLMIPNIYELKFQDNGIWLINPNGYATNQIALMQYTGLKDKNGKEIYEGDILRYNYHQKEPDTNFIMEVIFEDRDMEEGEASFRNIGFILRAEEDKEYWYADIPRLKDIEIIGDIYSTPDLLEKGAR